MTNPFKTYKIDNLFFRSFALFIVIVLVCTVWVSYRISSTELVRTNTHYQQQFLDKLNNEITTRLSTIEQISLSTSRANDLIAFLSNKASGFDRYLESKDVNQTLANLTYSMPLIQGIDLYMEEPIRSESNSYIQFRDLEEEASEGWSGSLKQNDFAWSKEHAVPSFQGAVPVLSFARKVVYEDKYLGILVIHIKSDLIREMLAGQDNGVNRMVLDGTGQYLLTTGKVPDEATLSEWLQVKKELTGNSPADRGIRLADSLYVHSELTNYGWVLLEVTPWEVVTAGSVKLASVIIMISCAAILLLLLLTHWLSRQFMRPIKQLVSAMGSYTVSARNSGLPTDYSNEFGALFAGYRKQNERIEELYRSLQHRYQRQRKAEIEALQANINPHFLYNTLDQLNWMAIAAGEDEMSRILELMGRMFRIGLSSGVPFIKVEEEIAHIECYLEIQQLRWQTGFTYTVAVPPEIRDLYLPKMLLQPFVENSVLHGFNGRSSGHVDIRMDCGDHGLRIVIDDNGTGLPSGEGHTGEGHTGEARTGKRRTGGYGIRNVRERVEAYFGKTYGISLQSRPEGGTRAEIILPCLEKPPEETLPEAMSTDNPALGRSE